MQRQFDNICSSSVCNKAHLLVHVYAPCDTAQRHASRSADHAAVYVQCVVRSLLKHMQLGTPAKGTFAHMLLRVKDPATGQPLTDAKMLPEIAALYFAGIDTTGARTHGAGCCQITPLLKGRCVLCGIGGMEWLVFADDTRVAGTQRVAGGHK